MVAVIALNSQTFLGHNQEAYQDLRLALQLNLRRQLLIAVCDDHRLQAQLAQRLENDLSPYSTTGTNNPEVRADQSPLVTLHLDAHHPDLVREVLLWLKQQRWLSGSPQMIPAFQIVGVETLMRQSPTLQNRFLASLLRIDALLTQLDCRLLVWVPRPWLAKIQQVVPGFWRSRSGLFEFAGEPTAADWSDLNAPIQPADSSQAPPTPLPPLRLDPQATPPQTAEATTTAEPIRQPPLPSSLSNPALSLGHLPGSHQPPKGETVTVELTIPLPPELAEDQTIAELWQFIGRLKSQQTESLTVARAYLALGQLSRDRVEAGALAQPVIDFALAVYRQAIAALPEGAPDWCDALNDLASLYWLRSQQEAHPEAVSLWLHRSAEAYQQALRGGLAAPAATLNRLYSNLGGVYTLLASFDDPLSSLKQAVQVYHQALHYLSPETNPLDYANLQNSLGAVCWRLSQLERPQPYLHQAITAYTEALRYQSPQAAPQEYAMLQNNLGIAYWSLAQHERPLVLLEQAIAAYRAALTHRTLATHPAGCAATYNNLGTAYWDLAQQQVTQPTRRLDTLRQALAAYEAALKAAERALQPSPSEPLGFDVWATFHSAGVVHDQIAQALPADHHEARDRHLQSALNHYLLAYQGWQHNPEQMEILVDALVYTVRLNFEILGLPAQQVVLSKLPPALLAKVLPKL